MKKLLLLIVAITLFATGCTAEVATHEQPTPTQKEAMDETAEPAEEAEVAEEMPEEAMENFLDVDMMDINGNQWNLSKLEKKAVVKVWASWCSVCLSGLGEYNEFTKTYEDAQVLTVVSPDMLGEKSKEDFLEWYAGMSEYQDTVVILDETGVLLNGLGIRSFPTYVYINSEGYVDSGAIGHQASADIVTRLESIS